MHNSVTLRVTPGRNKLSSILMSGSASFDPLRNAREIFKTHMARGPAPPGGGDSSNRKSRVAERKTRGLRAK